MYCTTNSTRGELRAKMVDLHRAGMTVTTISERLKVARTTVYRWLRRESLESRSPIPRYQPRKTPAVMEEIVREVREETGGGPWLIGIKLSMATSTVYKILCRLGINRLAKPMPAPAPMRYEYAHPGELVHVDVKKLGTKGLVPLPRSIRSQLGRECLHIMIDDCTRWAFCAIYPDETAASCAEFLERGTAHFASLGVPVQRVLTDNGAGYVSERWHNTCALLGIRPTRTRPHHPQTNGKVERWIRTLMTEAIIARVLPSLQARETIIQNFVNFYNTQRPHKALGGKTPLRRLAQCSVAV
jgi:transposase InsO family protein